MIKQLGKIDRAYFGFGGYQNCQIVFELKFSGDGWGCFHTFECGWGHVSEEELKKPGATFQWTHESRLEMLGKQSWEVFKLIKAAKKDHLHELVGVPVECTFDSPCGKLLDFRILTEVL